MTPPKKDFYKAFRPVNVNQSASEGLHVVNKVELYPQEGITARQFGDCEYLETPFYLTVVHVTQPEAPVKC